MEPHGTFEQALAAFAADLRRLRIERGSPSYRDLAARAERTGHGIRLPVATQSDVFRGKRLPGFDTFMTLVRILHAYDGYGREVPVPAYSAPALTPWRTRWRTLAARQPDGPAGRAAASAPAGPAREGAPARVRPAPHRSLAARALDEARRGSGVQLPPLDVGAPLFRVAFSPDGAHLAATTGAEVAHLWDPVTRRADARLTAAAWALAFSPDGSTLATARGGRGITLWNVADGGARATLAGHRGAVKRAVYAPDGELLATAGADATVRLWDPAAATAVGGPLTGHLDEVLALAFSPDGTLLAGGGADKLVWLWDLPRRRGAPGRLLRPGSGMIWAVAFSPDSRMLVTAGADGTVRRWDPLTAQPRGEALVGHRGEVYEAAFSPDGALLATAGADGTVRLWDPHTGVARGEPLLGDGPAVKGVAFSPDGSVLASCGLDGTVRRWIVGPL
ncbi:WD40 repeat domain-containing protein [Streptomyces sp. NPDC054787]